ncbi:hypothetical protein MRB53_011433 [Persea americana]|uniref:Uncharacterized protein n=1 Tax=Persea americana TaxID=3435 RepID=A0ACC2LUL0_PERAE|nr:hypothetical protein MRB53_011433 [Persea americana]
MAVGGAPADRIMMESFRSSSSSPRSGLCIMPRSILADLLRPEKKQDFLFRSSLCRKATASDQEVPNYFARPWRRKVPALACRLHVAGVENPYWRSIVGEEGLLQRI